MSTKTPDPAAVEQTGKLMSRARRLLAYGGFDGVVQRPLFYEHGGVFPQFAREANGYELIDTTGQSYVDWVNGWGPVLLGYRHPRVEEAIRAQLPAGPTLSLMHPIEVEVAELLADMIPCADMVAFGKNGSDVLTAAVRVARAVTGRQVILQYGMHGFHDWYVCLFPEAQGIPDGLRQHIHTFRYNDPDQLRELFRSFSGKVAAVVMEPVREYLPRPGYLEGVREITRKHGALLIFDEVVTAFRLANGGAQELYGITPDLACVGKSMGNGMPLSAIVGKREYMQYLPGVGFGMTFRGETLSLAAARAVLEVLRTEPVAEHLASVGEAVRAGFRSACETTGVKCDLLGPPARMTFEFHDTGDLTREGLRALFLQECLKNGVFTNGNLLASYAHDEVAVQRTVAGLQQALTVVATAIRAGSLGNQQPLGGAPFGPRPLIATGFIDGLGEDEDGLHVSGWMLLDDSAPDRVEFVSRDGKVVPAETRRRPDVAEAFRDFARADQSGYAAVLQKDIFKVEDGLEFTLRAMRGATEAFICRVFIAAAMDRSGGAGGPYPIRDGVLYI